MELANWTAEKPPAANTEYDTALHENEFPTQCNHCRTTKAALGREIKYMVSVCVYAHLRVDGRRERMSERQHFI
jgi:hypothetical protein